ncbi:acyl-CoA thioesterase [Pseudonocardia alaniniphila]|uniref:Thioesterase family protein n=1 Tax=Pseudonocardia alaniniphila TaxID=75291 RepID=A0ABS9TD34_9PSEU|nr:acyl-CoA thioesterase [Pseudonocardia alaniniphila]MCH6166432.1 thioesterase family protein [Pseudonocardia alaniniphila]
MGIFSVQLAARHYEVDFNGHVNNAAYYDWADHVRLEFLRRAGVVPEIFMENKVGPVILEAQARYLRELRIGEPVSVTCGPTYGSGRTFTFLHRFIRADGVLATELVKIMGMLDHGTRRLVADPHRILRALAARPDLLEPAGATAREQHE